MEKYDNGYKNKIAKMHKVRIDAINHFNDKRPKGRSYILPKDISNAGKKAELPIDVKKFANRNKNLPVAVGKVNTTKDKAKTATRSTFTGNGAKKITLEFFTIPSTFVEGTVSFNFKIDLLFNIYLYGGNSYGCRSETDSKTI